MTEKSWIFPLEFFFNSCGDFDVARKGHNSVANRSEGLKGWIYVCSNSAWVDNGSEGYGGVDSI